MAKFNQKEKKNYMFKKHIQNHLFEYILDFFGPIVLTVILLYLCKAEEIWIGIIFSVFYSLGRLCYNLIHYKKEYVDVDIED